MQHRRYRFTKQKTAVYNPSNGYLRREMPLNDMQKAVRKGTKKGGLKLKPPELLNIFHYLKLSGSASLRASVRTSFNSEVDVPWQVRVLVLEVGVFSMKVMSRMLSTSMARTNDELRVTNMV